MPLTLVPLSTSERQPGERRFPYVQSESALGIGSEIIGHFRRSLWFSASLFNNGPRALMAEC
jgi:hypothetical protein